MKITKINASFSCKKQIRQYEPIDIFMAVEAEVDDMEDIPTLQAKLFDIAKAGVDHQIEILTGQKSTPVRAAAPNPVPGDGDLPF